MTDWSNVWRREARRESGEVLEKLRRALSGEAHEDDEGDPERTADEQRRVDELKRMLTGQAFEVD